VATSSLLFVGIKGSVVALDQSSSEEVWTARLDGSDFVNLAVQDSCIYATTRGEVFCLSAVSGEIRWHNPLKGFGLGLATIGLPGGQIAPLAEKVHRDQAAASAGATTAAVG